MQKRSSGSLKMCLAIQYLIYTYKKDLALNIIQWLIFHKTKPNQTNEVIKLATPGKNVSLE